MPSKKPLKKHVKMSVLSDNAPEDALSDSTNLAASTGNEAHVSNTPIYASAAQIMQQETEDDMELQYSPEPAPKARLRGKGARMLKELSDYNRNATSSSDAASPEALLEGLHGTRATRKNVNNAVNNRAPSLRKSLNTKALMEAELCPDARKKKQQRKRNSIPRRKRADSTGGTSSELDEVIQEKAKVQQTRKIPRVEDVPDEMTEALRSSKAKARATKSTKNKKRKTPRLETPEWEDVEDGDEDEDYLSAEKPAYLQRPSLRGNRRSSRDGSGTLDSTADARTNAPNQEAETPKIMTSGMTWDEKKDVIAWILQKIDYGPYRPQVSRLDLGDLDLTRWFNNRYPGFEWDISNGMVAHFSPSAGVFRRFESFLHVIEFFSGQQNGAVTITVPQNLVLPPAPVSGIASRNISVRVHETCISLHTDAGYGGGAIHSIAANTSHNVMSQSLLKALETDRRYLFQGWSCFEDEPGEWIWRESQIMDRRTEVRVLASNWGLFAENLQVTCPLRESFQCTDPCLFVYPGNKLQESRSTKIGINLPAFDMCSVACGMQMTELGAYKLVYHQRGGPRVWTIVKPADFQKVEALVAETLDLGERNGSGENGLSSFETPCFQFVGHKRLSKTYGETGIYLVEDPGKTLYFSTESLEMEGIKYTRFVQYPGELVIIFPFSYYQSYNVGPNVMETMAYASNRWEIFPKANLLRQCGRGCFQGRQPKKVKLGFTKPVTRATDGSSFPIEDVVEYTRSCLLR